ncbi:MAG: DNA repair protein RadA [Candidatus Gracilibacteria bacterium]|nr:DNA repair protein RadA [Candidatus Gracilibacteria bacterium]
MQLKTIYLCKGCGYESSKWLGKCPSCSGWNSFVEDVISTGSAKSSLSKTPRSMKIAAKETSTLSFQNKNSARLTTGIEEFDRVIGNGFTQGSLTLLSGEPGIGKSTLTLQIANKIAKNHKVLLISGEESLNQIAERNIRLGFNEKNLVAINEYNLEIILETMRKEKPAFVIIDSIQVIASLDIPSQAGSISQVRYCTESILELSKTSNITTMLIGHVTKDGTLAGPRVLEHLVDTVISLEGDRYHHFRMLRASKNRFGNCSEVGIFEMNEKGLSEVKNPSKQFLEGRIENAIGSAITVAMEGTRPFLVEVQALVSITHFGYPKRTANGFDMNRLQILIAILEKYGRLNLQNQDIFINIVGGIRLDEPAADLAVIIAIASSYLKKTIPNNTIIFGEAGLSGELRKAPHSEKRIKEANKLGFEKIISPEKFKKVIESLSSLV